MSHEIFALRPWLTNAHPLPNAPVGMLGRTEAKFFYHLAKDAFTGRGTIVDAGSFLGKSAYCFAKGLQANPMFDSSRHRVHCFDNFLVNEVGTIDFICHQLGQKMSLGESTREIFERQVAPVRDLLEVHEGDFHVMPWQHQPIEILMIDIAKSESLGKRVVEVFFPDLVPGLSIVGHQDYHHPWLPHIHVVMEYLADCFQLVAPRLDDSAGFVLTREIPAEMLRRAVDYDFSIAEQIALMDRAVERLPVEDRHVVELARLTLRLAANDWMDVRAEFESVERRNTHRTEDATWVRYVDGMRNSVDQSEGWQQRNLGHFERSLQLADNLIARGCNNSHVLSLRAASLGGLGRHGEAELVYREAL